MTNFLNPLEWLKSTQDWFSKTEKSSGFRPYLVYQLISFSAGILLISISNDGQLIQLIGALLVVIPTIFFIPLFAWKSHTDPNFCRSESHIQKMTKYELEAMGSEAKQISGEVLENNGLGLVQEPPQIAEVVSEEGQQ